MSNLTAVRTATAGRYNLVRLESSSFTSGSFVALMIAHKHLIYDWGAHYLFACKVPFLVNYHQKTIVGTDAEPINDNDWIGSDPVALHTLLQDVFEGVWGPTAADTIARLLRSDIEVHICNSRQHGPSDPVAYLSALKRELAVGT